MSDDGEGERIWILGRRRDVFCSSRLQELGSEVTIRVK